MSAWWQWILGLDAPPDWIAGGMWHLEFYALPSGLGAGGCLALIVAAVWGVWYLYRREGREIPPLARHALAAMRLLVLLGVSFMLLQLVLVLTNKELVPSHLLVLLDTSESMGLADPYADAAVARPVAQAVRLLSSQGEPDVAALRKQTRLELAQRALTIVAPKLAEGRELSAYNFAAQLDSAPSVAELGKLRATGIATAVGDAVHNALAAHRGQPLAGVLLVTEGQSNSGSDPLQIAAQASRQGVPINVLAVGTEHGPRNVRLADLETSPVVFVRDQAEISAILESRSLKGDTAIVRLEQRAADGEWKEMEHRDVVLDDDQVLERVTFQFTPESLGQLELRVRVTDAGPELTEADNLDTRSIKVIRQKIRVLLLAGSPAPEVQFLRNALLRDKALEFASWLQSAEPGYEQQGSKPILRLPATQEELDHYDVLLLFDPDLQQLPPEWPEMVTQFVGSAAGGLIYVAGELHTQDLFNDAAAEARLGANSGSAWTRLLPVVREPGMYQSAAEVQLSLRESWFLELTPQGVEDPIFRFADDPARNRDVLANLPGMYWHFPVTRAKPGASVLARHGDPRMRNNFGRHVLLATQFYGPGRTVFVGFDSTYRWRYLDEGYFDGFWARLIDRVGRNKVLGGRFPFSLASDKAVYRVGDQVTVRAEFVSGGDIAPGLAALGGELEVGDRPAVAVSLEPAPDNPRIFQATFPAAESGLHTLRILPTGEAEAAPRTATLTFRVEPPHQELDRPVLNRSLLDSVARASGGKVCTLAELDQVPDMFRVRQVERVLEYRQELWDAPVLFGSVMILLTLEWLLRKKYRLA